MQSSILIVLFTIVLMIFCFVSTNALPPGSSPLSSPGRSNHPSSHSPTHNSRTSGASKPKTSHVTRSTISRVSRTAGRPTARAQPVRKQSRSVSQTKNRADRQKRLSTWNWA